MLKEIKEYFNRDVQTLEKVIPKDPIVLGETMEKITNIKEPIIFAPGDIELCVNTSEELVNWYWDKLKRLGECENYSELEKIGFLINHSQIFLLELLSSMIKRQETDEMLDLYFNENVYDNDKKKRLTKINNALSYMSAYMVETTLESMVAGSKRMYDTINFHTESVKTYNRIVSKIDTLKKGLLKCINEKQD